MSNKDEIKAHKVQTAMEEVQALIHAVSNYNADEVRAAAKVGAPHHSDCRWRECRPKTPGERNEKCPFFSR